MSKKVLWCTLALGCLVAALAPIPATAQVCAPLDDGRVAEPFYEGTVIFWEPVVDFREMVLTISGPCEDIIKVFKKGEPISFDIREITKVTDGTYTWQLRRVSNIDPGVQEKLEGARGTGEEDALWWSFFQAGAIPEGPYVDSASFTVERGVIIDPNQVEGKLASVASRARGAGSALAAGLTPASSDEAAGGNGIATRDQVIPDDLIVQGSACVGFDCVNGESFGFDTIRLKENNLRIQFDDTSSVSGFPTGNWQIRANSSSSGGQSFLGFVDQGASGTTETGTIVFAVEASARANALYVESDGDVGLGTSNPVLDLHISSSNTPAIRLEQTNAGGFTAQTWDIAGNEANFFVRDVTGGSTLPFRIRPDAPSSSIDIAADGDVGIGTASPAGRLHVENTSGDDADDFLVTSDGQLTIGSTAAGSLPTLMKLTNPVAGTGGGAVRFVLENSSGNQWSVTNDNVGGGELEINYIPNAGTEVVIDGSGNVTATSFNPTSSRSLKDDLELIEPRKILTRLSELPISTWSFIQDESEARHLGPMAEDFKAAFGLGDSDKTINLTDAAGVAFAAIQGLNLELQEKNAEISNLQEQNDELLERLERLESMMRELETP